MLRWLALRSRLRIGSQKACRPAICSGGPRMSTTVPPKPSASSSPSGRLHRIFLARLAPALQNPAEAAALRAVLSLAQQAGLTPQALYQEAVKGRPKGWSPAPPYGLVRPRSVRRSSGPEVLSQVQAPSVPSAPSEPLPLVESQNPPAGSQNPSGG